MKRNESAGSRSGATHRPEQQYTLQPLALPSLEHVYSLEDLACFPSVALFVERATAVNPRFLLTEDNAPAVAEICRRLDGLPLAIELITPRIKMFSPSALLQRIQEHSSLRFLTSGAKDLPERQQTLRSAIGWSYELLTEEEKRFFNRMAVFAGGCTIDIAEQVFDEPDILEILESLVDKSLLCQQEQFDCSSRLLMLDTIREYALEQLHLRGEIHTMNATLTNYYLQLVEQAEPELRGKNQIQWLNTLQSEMDNIRSALDWSVQQPDKEQGLRIASALWRFWYIRGYLAEGRTWLERALQHSDSSNENVRAKALDALGIMAMEQGELEESRQYHEIALQIYQAIGDNCKIAGNLESIGLIYMYMERYEEATEMFNQSLEIRRKESNIDGIATSLNNLYANAISQGKYVEAAKHAKEALDIIQVVGNEHLKIKIIINQGYIACHQGDFTGAENLYKDALGLNRDLKSKSITLLCLEGLITVAINKNELDRAARLHGAADMLYEETGIPYSNLTQSDRDENIDAARQNLGENLWQGYWSDGKRMTFDQATLYARSDIL